MRPALQALARLRRADAGLTLIELLLAAMIGLVVVGGAMTVFIGAIKSEPRTASKVDAIQDARVTIERITREVRQGIDLETAAENELSVVTYVKAASCGGLAAATSIPCRVTYTCSGTTCSRVVAQPDGSAPGPSVQVAEGLSGANVFSYVPSKAEPGYVGVTFQFAADEGEPVTLDDGVDLRNLEEEESA
jgi:type II secretory pathway pseudopilin PulG